MLLEVLFHFFDSSFSASHPTLNGQLLNWMVGIGAAECVFVYVWPSDQSSYTNVIVASISWFNCTSIAQPCCPCPSITVLLKPSLGWCNSLSFFFFLQLLRSLRFLFFALVNYGSIKGKDEIVLNYPVNSLISKFTPHIVEKRIKRQKEREEIQRKFAVGNATKLSTTLIFVTFS